MAELFHRLKEDFKARRRGEQRIASGMRGRVYARKGEDVPPSDAKNSGHQARLSVSAEVTRADGSIENYVINDGKAVRV